MAPSEATHKNVQTILDGVTGSPESGVPGLVFVAIDKHGDYVTTNASGKRGITSSSPMDVNTVFWIASCTKLLATIACLQCVEQGKLQLDDPKHLYRYCPELEAVKVLQDDGTLVDKQHDITLRMLLSHTAGFGYEFFSPKLRDYGRPTGFDFFRGTEAEIVKMPLVNQPGEKWEYGINIDWAGIYLERVTGVSLGEHMEKQIFEPLGVTDVGFFPTAEMKANLAHMHQRWPGSLDKIEERDQCMSAQLRAETAEDKERVLNSGGAGCFAKPAEYVSKSDLSLSLRCHRKERGLTPIPQRSWQPC